MHSLDYDVIIIGQGIAGTTLAWVLQQAGKSVLILDEGAETTSSKIAAGLVTPITGKRFVVSRDYDTFYENAVSFYAGVSKALGEPIFHERVSKRYLRTDKEKKLWAKRLDDQATQDYVTEHFPDDGGFAMRGAQLDVATYINKSRFVLNVERYRVDWEKDIKYHTDFIEIFGVRAKFVISCQGFAAHKNPYFDWVPFNAAKGEILQIRFNEKVDLATHHFGLWMAPAYQPNTFFVGATYDWHNLDQCPTEQGRREIEKRLKDFINISFDVLAHHAAVRPIIFQSMAVIGTHPEKSRLGYFNGLGSKGSLQAPWYARKLAEYLFGAGELEHEINVSKYWP